MGHAPHLRFNLLYHASFDHLQCPHQLKQKIYNRRPLLISNHSVQNFISSANESRFPRSTFYY